MLLTAGSQVMCPKASEHAAWSSETTGSPAASLQGGTAAFQADAAALQPQMPKPTCARHMRGISRLAGDGSRCFPRPFALSDCSVPTRHILPDLNWDFKPFSQNLATHTRSDAADKLRHPSMLCRQQGMVTPALHNKVIAATSSSAVFWLLSADTHILGHFCRICTATRS